MCDSPWSQNALSGTPTKFDGGYYAEVIGVNGVKGQFGWFASDMHGFCNTFKARSGGSGSPNAIGRKLMQARPSFPPCTSLTTCLARRSSAAPIARHTQQMWYTARQE
jgi:hypothetical protein